MTDLSKLFRLLDDPEIRVLIFGLAHAGPAYTDAVAGPARLRVVVAHLLELATADQRRSWLSEGAANAAMSSDHVRRVIGPDAIDDVARYTAGGTVDVTYQLAMILPDLADALTPGGVLVRADELATELREASAESDRSDGAFGPHVH